MSYGPVLRRWSVHNFKSIEMADLELAPLTLLAGKNSAGKSSIIQSLLMFAQSSDVLTDGHIPLNGALTSLGLFEDAVSSFAEQKEISFEGDFELPGRLLASPIGRDFANRARLERALTTVHWECTLVEDPKTDESRLGKGLFEQVAGDERFRIDFRALASPGLDSSDELNEFGAYRVRVRKDEQEGTQFDYAQFASAIPINGLRSWSEVDWWIADVETDLKADRLHLPSPRRRTKAKEKIELDDDERLQLALERLSSYVINSIQEETAQREAGVPYFQNVITALNLSASEVNFMIAKFEELADGIKANVDRQLGAMAEASHFRPDPGSLGDSIFSSRLIHGDWQQFWARRVKYLGPLREEPRAAYSRHRSNTPFAPIGVKGEYFASFLHNYPNRLGSFPMPDGTTQQLTLQAALTAWMRHLRIADTVEINPRGRLGLEVLVDQHNVTSVGTGVSQLLPVLVVCLAAEVGTLTLLEQPEIHVEPGAQQLLAEFLLAIAQSGRQLIVETHSEYLITRLRLLAAQESEQTKDFAIYFAEQDGDRSVFRPVRVTSGGGIEDWPIGFFDQAASDARELMLRAMRSTNESDEQPS